ncbi:MAG: poly(R)-hydroxyalkanoic acid synthase subunit PhaE [Gammaproteobacteria bacterium]|nr:poly(R)-hydroxyalkanoic acid synthase subunit PhaE [Gammaproteobacteria bacterium]
MSKDYFNQPLWGGEWKELFEEYLNNVQSFTGFPGARETKAQQWQKAMEYWWSNFQPEMPEFANPTATRLLEQAKSFYFLGQHLTELLNNLSQVRKDSDSYLQQLAGQIESMKSVIQDSQAIGHQSVSELLDAWQIPGETWSGILQAIPGMDKDITRALKTDDLDSFMDKYLNLPGVGYAREFQEKIQKNLMLLKKFLKAQEDYNDAMNKVGVEALDTLSERIIKMAENKEEISSLRQLYNIWVDCNEEAYADFVFTSEYSVLYGELVNSLMDYKKNSNELRDEILQASSLPTRTDLEAMQKQTASLVKKLHQAVTKNRSDERRIEELELQVAELKNSTGVANPGEESRAKKSVGKATGKTARKTGRKTAAARKKKTKVKTAAKKKSKSKARAKKNSTKTKTEAKASEKVVNIASAKDKASGRKKTGKASKQSGNKSGKKTIEIKF